MQKITQLIVAGGSQALALPETFLRAFNDLYSRQTLTSAAITAAVAVTATFSAFHAVVSGVLVRVAAGNTPSLTGYNLTAAQVGGFVLTTDASGILAALPIQPAATVGGVGWPQVPAFQAVFGLVLINTTAAAIFTGGSTLTNAANVTLASIVGPFNPTNAF